MPAGNPSVDDFLGRGLLPENLPPVFTSQAVPAAFAAYGANYAVTSKVIGEPATYNASKRGGQRRLFSVPHPIFVRDQALFFEKNWASISNLLNASAGSVSAPEFVSGPRHVRLRPHRELPELRLKRFSRFRYSLVTDVARFFPSVYTHSIPWALNGKEAAKGDTNPNSAAVYGNKLDFASRQSQSKQTIGIAVGPDTSKITAEILMCAIDVDFVRRSGRAVPTFLRHVDDYWVAGDSIEECEKHLQNLRASLAEFQLDINEGKTRIISNRYVFGDDWPFNHDKELREAFSPLGAPAYDPVALLSKIVNDAIVQNDDGIIRHAVKKIDEQKLWVHRWDILEHFLAQCAVQFPHSIDYVVRVVAWRLRRALPVAPEMWLEIARNAVLTNAGLGRDSEVVWALWLLKELGARATKDITDLVVENCGAIPLAFLAHMCAKRQTTDRALMSRLRAVVEGEPYGGRHWLLVNEMHHLGAPDPAWVRPAAPAAMFALIDTGTSLLNWDAAPKVFQADDAAEPDHAIEDYGADYGGDDEEEEDDGVDDFDVGNPFDDLGLGF